LILRDRLIRLEQVFSRHRLIDYSFLSLLSLYGLYLIHGIFNEGYFSNFDLSEHFTESVYFARVLLLQYHQFIGWNPYLYLGWPQGQFNPVGSYIVFSVIYYLLSWALSPLLIFKIMIAIFFLLQGWSIYYASKWFGLNQLSGFVAGFIMLGTAGGFEVGGPLDIMYYGMYEFAIAIALIPFILALFHQSFVRQSLRLLLITAVLTAFDFLLHNLAGVFLLVALLVYTLAQLIRFGIFHSERRKNLLRIIAKFGALVLVVLGICSFWLLPAYANRSSYDTESNLIRELGVYSATYNQLRLGTIFGEQSMPLVTNFLHPVRPSVVNMVFSPTQPIVTSGPLTFYQLLMVLAIIGILFALVKSRSRFPILVILFLIGLFMYLSLGPSYYPYLWKYPSFQLVDARPERASALARNFLGLLVGAGIGESFNAVKRATEKIKKKMWAFSLLKLLEIVLFLTIGVILVTNSYLLMSQIPLGVTTNNVQGGNNLSSVFVWIKENVPPTSRVAFEEYPTPNQHSFAAAPVETGISEVGSGYAFWWSGADASQQLEVDLSSGNFLNSESIYSILSELNAGYVVVFNPSLVSLLNSSSQEFQLLTRIGQFYIFQLKGYSPNFVSVIGGIGNATIQSFQPEKITIKLQNMTEGSQLLIKESYYSNWEAYSNNGKMLSIRPYAMPYIDAEYMEVILPSNKTSGVTLLYQQTNPEMAGNLISYFALTSIIAAYVFASIESKIRLQIADPIMLALKRAMGLVRPSRGRRDPEG
jgi:hypothetical protein